MTTGADTTSKLQSAIRYLHLGWMPIDVPFKSKIPVFAGWQHSRFTEADLSHRFNGHPQNIGILLGEPSGGLVDTDLDCIEAVRIAPHVLPKTDCIFGRVGNPASHHEFVADPIPKTTQFADADGKKIIELRSTGAQTIFPPSTHESGEPIKFIENAGEPAHVDGNLLVALVSKVAALAIMARHWPAEGSRHDAALALCGGLARAGWAAEDIADAARLVAEAAGDDDVEDRVKCAETSFDRVASGDKATGWKKLAEIIGDKVVSRVKEWLGIKRNDSRRHDARAGEKEPYVFSPGDPLPIARAYRADEFQHADGPTLYFSGGTFQHHDDAKYIELGNDAVRAGMYEFLDRAKKLVTIGKEQELRPFAPNIASVSNSVDALKAVAYTDAQSPCWLGEDPNFPDPAEILAMANGLVRLRNDGPPELFRPPTPLWFSPNAVDYDFIADASTPAEWLKFLDVLWPDDRESIELLQEWFGYVLTADTRQQKILLLIGPPRSGKGTIARVLARMIGLANVCAPTLAGLATNFGLWSLIGKLVAIISDARLSGRTDQAIVTERLLSISGGDAITIDRKNLEPLTQYLWTRITMLSNEMPRLADASGALANRFVVLRLTKSFLGKEDTALTDRLLLELPGILLWSIAGWRRLRARGRFVQPATSQNAIDEMMELSSPVSAFIRDFCAVRPGLSCIVSDLFDGWRAWCAEQGREQPGTVSTFGRDLRAAQPGIETRQRREDGDRQRVYEGIDMTEAGKMAMFKWRASRDGTRANV